VLASEGDDFVGVHGFGFLLKGNAGGIAPPAKESIVGVIDREQRNESVDGGGDVGRPLDDERVGITQTVWAHRDRVTVYCACQGVQIDVGLEDAFVHGFGFRLRG